MSSWNHNDELNIHNSLCELIPDKLKKYKLTNVFLTTFSLDMDYVNEVLFELDALGLIAEKAVEIFYDKFSRNPAESGSQLISEKNMHGIERVNAGKSYAFHPKIILLRYENNGEIFYLILVSSKNLTKSNLLDAYAAAYGRVEESDENQNGRQAADFFKEFFGSIDSDIFSELEKVSFHQEERSSAVSFLDSGSIINEIEDKKDIIIVSPFLSDKLIKDIEPDNIKLIVSTDTGYASLDKETFNSLNNKRSLGENLHAKIYCRKDADKTCYIIGSSNATNNGFKEGNIEFNLKFTRPPEDYDDFLNFLNSAAEKQEYQLQSDFESEFSARNCFYDFCKSISISCEKNKETNEYKCIIAKNNNHSTSNIPLSHYNVYLSLPNQGVPEIFNTLYTLSSDKPFGTVDVVVEDKSVMENRSVFSLSIYDMWDEEAKASLEKIYSESYVSHIRHIQNQIFAGRKASSAFGSRRLSESNKTVGRRASVDKAYLYEKIMDLSAECSKDEEFQSALNLLEKYEKMIADPEKSSGLLAIIDKLRGSEVNRHE